MRILSGAMIPNEGTIKVNGEIADIQSPHDARDLGIETIYQTLALADHLNAPANLFLGRELKTRFGNLDDNRMMAEAVRVLKRLNPNFKNLNDPVSSLSGGQRQVVGALIRQLREEGIGILLVSHDMHDVFELCDRVIVMNKGRKVGSHRIEDVTKDDVLSLIIKGDLPHDWAPRSRKAVQ
jgi:D-xylose transport system ATP-binding protein